MGTDVVDLRHLRYFVAVAEAGHVGRAAHRLHVAQPALSRQVLDLEADLRVELLTRGPKGVTLTPSGAALQGGAVRLFESIASAMDHAAEAASGERGHCVISIGHAIAWDMAGVLIEGVRRRAPHIELSLVQNEAGPEQWGALRSGAVDAFIGVEPRSTMSREFAWSVIRTEALMHVLLARDHPLAGRATLTPDDLAPFPFLWVHAEMHPELTDRVRAELKRLGIQSPFEATATGPLTLWMLVAAGRGWTLMPQTVVNRPPQDTVAVPLPGVRVDLRAVFATRVREARPAVLRVRDIVLEDIAAPAHRMLPSRPTPTRSRLPALHREPGTLSRTLELRHLRAALAIVTQGSLGRAAESLGISQPALARQLKELEREIGAPLVTRTTQGVSPSPAATALASDCATILERVVELVALVSRTGRGTRGGCVIGSVTPAAAGALVGEVVRACAAEHPDIHVTVEDVPSPHQARALRNGEIDLGVSIVHVGRVSKDVQVAKLTEDAISGALLAESHPLAGKRELEGSELATTPFLFMSSQFQPQFHAQVMKALARAGLVPRVDQTYDGLQTSWRLAAENRGWALAFDSHRVRPPTGLVAVPIRRLRIPLGLELHWRRGEQSPVVLAVRDLFRRRRPRD
jgi:DNA-binding transcriptional LysR family regulator